jgi:hypothetical protein
MTPDNSEAAALVETKPLLATDRITTSEVSNAKQRDFIVSFLLRVTYPQSRDSSRNAARPSVLD